MLESEILSSKQRFGIIGNSPLLNHAIRVAIQVASTDMTVLITGESGSGKESFSKIIHHLSARKHNSFIAINCGAIPEGTIDSELFGHEKGSFTGASEARKGYFEVTNGGTIFLDEIAEMPLGTQARLLRVLENGEYIKVGSSKVQKTDVRVVAATHANLISAVEKGKFREDLYYRLNTVPIYVPPLRERGQDIVLLFKKFSIDFAEKYHTKPINLSPEAIETLLKYSFPGNIRQLKNLVEQISVLEFEREISQQTLISYLPQNSHKSLPSIVGENNNADPNFNERELLYKVLFDMKRDMSELKKLVYEALQNDSLGKTIIDNHADLFKTIDHEIPTPLVSLPPARSSETTELILEKPSISNNNPVEEILEDLDIEEVMHEEHIETLSIEEKEKELIIRALQKHNNKRKNAANDLGISERTLYRKIKQYDI